MNSYELIIAANLEPAVPDGRACLQVFKSRHPLTWDAIADFVAPRAAAAVILDIVLSRNPSLAP